MIIPDHVLEHVRKYGSSMRISGPDIPGDDMSLMDYTLTHYKPWYVDLTADRNDIDASWFPLKDRSTVNGEYFGIIPSLSCWPHDGYILKGQQYACTDFVRVPLPELHKHHMTTGGGLLCLVKA